MTDAPVHPTSSSHAVLGGSAHAVEPPDATETATREAWHRRPVVKAGALFVVIAAIGVAEVALVGLPLWSAYVSAALAALIGLDQLQLARRARPVAAHAAAASGARRVLGYTNVPAADDGRALVADMAAVRTWCEQTGAVLVEMAHDVGGQGDREALAAALDRIAAGEVGALVVPRLDSLAPVSGSLPPVLRWFAEADRALVVIDPALDSATETGRTALQALAGVVASDADRAARGLEAERSPEHIVAAGA